MAATYPQPRVREGDLIGTAPDGMIGRILGDRYRVLSRLGEGGMGTVYLCEHAILRRRFALKVLRPELGGDPELVERFRNEAIAASRIGQENVVDVVDFGSEEDGALYYVMEALDGRSIGAILRDEGPFPVARALALLEQTCRALAAAHARGVVHRDVKPDNVFVVRREELERVKILDFGISHVPHEMSGSRLTVAGSIIGTPEYMAPEQASGGTVDHRADVYAVGVLAYEMLTGVLPIEAGNAVATLVAAQTRPPSPPSTRRRELPPEVDRIVLRALAKRPDDRFPTMLEFAAEIARVRAGIFGAGSTPDPHRGAAPTMRYEPAARQRRSSSGTVSLGEPLPDAGGVPTRPPVGPAHPPSLALVVVGGVVLAGLILAGGLYLVLREPVPARGAGAQSASSNRAGPAPVSGAAEKGRASDEPAPPPVAPPVEIVEPDKTPPQSGANPAHAPARARPASKPAQKEADPYGNGELKPDPFR